MLSSLKKMRGDKKGWYKVSDLRPGVEIARPRADFDATSGTLSDDIVWDEIVSIKPVGREQVYDIEVEGTHNFVGNGIFAHNTYVLKANTMLAVEGVVVPVPTLPFSGGLPPATTTSAIPPEVLTADGKGVDLYKLATYNLASVGALAAKVDEHGVRITSLETRVDKLESGAVSSASSAPSFSTTSLASALNEVGAYISRGFAQFGTLIADRFVAAVDSAGTSSAGTVNILAGNTVTQTVNSYVKPSTKIFITFNSPVTGSWYVSDKQDGSFKVVMSESQASDVSFDYFLVQTEGQLATSSPEVASGASDTVSTVSNTTPTTSTSTPEVQTPDSSVQSDTTPPVVTLVGEAAIEINVGDSFTDSGATATDDTDGDLTTHIIVSGTVDTATAGLYSLTYTATDAAGNTANVSRVVTVAAPAETIVAPAPVEEISAPADTTTPL